jgi:hypothetical protein
LPMNLKPFFLHKNTPSLIFFFSSHINTT